MITAHGSTASTRSPRATLAVAFFALLASFAPAAWAAPTPTVGQKAPDFTLSTPEGLSIHFAELTAKGDIVLIMLRGYPGYQCPYCQKQVHDYVVNADKFASAGAQVLLVYPGPSVALDQRAREFLGEQKLPANFHLVLDPDFSFTNLYGLRWDAPKETSYPSTFLVDRNGTTFFVKTSHTHGDRTTATDTLNQLTKSR